MKEAADAISATNRFTMDGHFDLLMDVHIQRERGRTRVIETDYYSRLVAGGIDGIIAAVFIDSAFVPEMALRKALGQIGALYEEAKESSDKLAICYSGADLRKAKASGKIGFLLSLEGIEPIGSDIGLLRVFYELGVRNIGLVWSRRNSAGDGSFFEPVREGRKGGLSSFGVQVVEEAERLGMTIDVSHLNDEGFWDVMKFSSKPVIASHSNARALCPVMRNLTDEQIEAIAESDGVIGVNAASFLVGKTDDEATLEQFVNHLDHLVNVAGIRHVGLGLDLCEDFMKYISQEDLMRMPRRPFDVIKGHQQVPRILEKLYERGYGHDDINAITGNNFLRIFGQGM